MNGLNEATSKYNKRLTSMTEAALTANQSWKRRFPDLMEHIEGSDSRKAMLAMSTIVMMENQSRALQNIMRDKKLEFTFSQALGPLVPRVLDVVRIFYPNLISNILFDIQIMDRQNGEIFLVKPRFSDTAAGVTAGQEIFANATDGTYASETTIQVIGTGDGTETQFDDDLTPTPVRPGTVVVTAGAVTGRDNGSGAITGTGITAGTIDYATGAIDIEFAAAPANLAPVTATFRYDSERSPSNIRGVHVDLMNMPVRAEQHPLNYSYSTTAELAASSHLELDLGDILANLSASFIKSERDQLSVNLVVNAATAHASLNFDAGAPTGYSKLGRFAEFEAKLDQGESLIQTTQGRGGVSWLLAGPNVANIIRYCPTFQPATDVVAPIGPHVIGFLRDGTVPVIKVPRMNANTYVIGFKGYVVGDAATILAEWIPLYASPLFRAPDLNNSQGLMSLYALVNNNPGYYFKGTVSNYVA